MLWCYFEPVATSAAVNARNACEMQWLLFGFDYIVFTVYGYL